MKYIGLIALVPLLGALIVVALSLKRRKNICLERQELVKELDSDKVDEITSTWNLLNH